ncbi:NACHT domain-containing protein [Amycolatopsis vastitatis]|uniref:NACHT domain-containing protein n=1 Tax=Amycolatopsis vastitatis TaxID=1905142 RepID=UPI0013044E60|nr:NACHT domain-containing protein [Amycolatopsis vastitatis]
MPGIERVTARQLREGTHRTLHRVYGGLASGRLILAGGAGSGKTSAAVLLLLDALRYREQSVNRAAIPVPVLFTLQDWDPTTTPLQEWLTTKLTELPPLAGRRGRARATALLNAERVSVFLDGLDEMPQAVRSVALQALSRQATSRLVLLTRTDELVEAARDHVLAGAVALELKPLTASDAAEHLVQTLTDPAPPHWRKLIDTLTDQPGSVVAQALTSPLTITLVRDVYPVAAAGHTPDELLDTVRFPRPDDITQHLLDQAITAAYTARPAQPPPRYSPDVAHRAMTMLATHLRDHGSRDFVRWDLPNWIPRPKRIVISALFGAAAGAALVGTLAVVGLSLSSSSSSSFADAAVHGFLVAAVGGLGFGTLFGAAAGWFPGVRPTTVGKVSSWRTMWGDFVSTFTLGVIFIRLIAIVLVDVMGGVVMALIFSDVLRGILFACITLAGAVIAIMSDWIDPPAAMRPHGLWRADLAVKLSLGLLLGLAVSAGNNGHLPDILARSLYVAFGLLMGLFSTEAWLVILSQIYFRIRWRTPLLLGRFLEDARARHLLRTVGPTYQFRHVTLQDRLAPPLSTVDA